MLRRRMPFVIGSLLLIGCSDDGGSTTPGPNDTGTSVTDTGAVMDTATAMDTGTAADTAADAGGFNVVQECAEADYVDATMNEALRKLDPWDVSSGKKCFKIKKAQSFTWTPTGGFSIHPLEGDGGDMPSPIAIVNTGTTTTLAFPNEGKFGYHCANHPLVMKGAIWVIP